MPILYLKLISGFSLNAEYTTNLWDPTLLHLNNLISVLAPSYITFIGHNKLFFNFAHAFPLKVSSPSSLPEWLLLFLNL